MFGPLQHEVSEATKFYSDSLRKLREIETELSHSQQPQHLPDMSTDTSPSGCSAFPPPVASYVLFTTKTILAMCFLELGAVEQVRTHATEAFRIAQEQFEHFQPSSLCILYSLFRIFSKIDWMKACLLVKLVSVLGNHHPTASTIIREYNKMVEIRLEEGNVSLRQHHDSSFRTSSFSAPSDDFMETICEDGSSNKVNLSRSLPSLPSLHLQPFFQTSPEIPPSPGLTRTTLAFSDSHLDASPSTRFTSYSTQVQSAPPSPSFPFMRDQTSHSQMQQRATDITNQVWATEWPTYDDDDDKTSAFDDLDLGLDFDPNELTDLES